MNEYCQVCEKLIDLDFDAEHEHFLEMEKEDKE